MHARTTELLLHLDTSRRLLADAFARVGEALCERRPSPDRWSAADVLSHLAMIEASVADILQRKLRRALAGEPLPAMGDEAPTWQRLEELLLDQQRKVEAPEFVVPDGTRSAADAWMALQESRPRLRQVLLAGDGLQTDGIVSRHVLLGPLTFHEWFGFVGYHEQRHALQIEALAADPGGD